MSHPAYIKLMSCGINGAVVGDDHNHSDPEIILPLHDVTHFTVCEGLFPKDRTLVERKSPSCVFGA